MKKILPVVLLFWGSHIWAQPSFDIELEQSVGHEWGLGLWGADSFAELPIPESGEEQAWDFTFLGNEENGNGVLFSEADSLNDYFSFYSFNDPSGLPTAGGGTVQDSFPNAIGCLLTDFLAFERYGTVLGQMGDELITYGEVEEVNGIFETVGVGSGQVNSDYQLPEQLGESFVQTDTVVQTDIDFNSLDSIFSYDSTIYLGYGTAEMFYGDVENVLMMRDFSETRTVSYNLTTGAFMSSGISRSVSYNFYQGGNLLPLLSYFFSVDANGEPTFDGPSLFLAVPFFSPISNSQENIRTPLRLKIAPNPVVDQCMIAFHLHKAGPVRIEMMALNGKQVFEKNLGHLGTGAQQFLFSLPVDLPAGLYLLKTTAADGQSGIIKVAVD